MYPDVAFAYMNIPSRDQDRSVIPRRLTGVPATAIMHHGEYVFLAVGSVTVDALAALTSAARDTRSGTNRELKRALDEVAKAYRFTGNNRP